MPKKPSKAKKVVDPKAVQPSGVQIHFGNVKIVELKLLEQIAKNTAKLVEHFEKASKE